MKITKFEHACLVVEVEGQRLVIDPGAFVTALSSVKDLVAIVITHEHADHWTREHLTTLTQASPEVRLFGPEGLSLAAKDFPIEVVKHGDHIEVGSFSLKFFGGKHAVIHESMPVVDNVGVLVNDELYFPGDAFTVPDDIEVGTLAVPTSGPWLKVGEVMDFVAAVAPRRCFAVHEMLSSSAGKAYVNNQLVQSMKKLGGDFTQLESGGSFTHSGR